MNETQQFPEFVRQFLGADLPFPGARAWLIQGGSEQVAFIEFDEVTDVPEHSHSEQWEIVISGRVLLRRGGEQVEFQAGESFFIPAGLPHSARVQAGYKAVIIFNEPSRYRASRSV